MAAASLLAGSGLGGTSSAGSSNGSLSLAVLGGGDVISFLVLTGLLLVGLLASSHFCHSRKVMAEGTICSHIDTPAQRHSGHQISRKSSDAVSMIHQHHPC